MIQYLRAISIWFLDAPRELKLVPMVTNGENVKNRKNTENAKHMRNERIARRLRSYSSGFSGNVRQEALSISMMVAPPTYSRVS